MKLILARHGQTQWNREKRLQGRRDSPLPSVGQSQARLLARLAVREKPIAVVSSDLQRAVSTASLATKQLGVKLLKKHALREIGYGRLEGLALAEIEESFPGVWPRRQKDRFRFRVPGGENYVDVAQRLKPFCSWLANRFGDETVLVVGHGNTNRVLMGLLLRYPHRKWLDIHQPNYVVYFLEVKNGRVRRLEHLTLGHHRKQAGLYKVKWWQ